MPDVLASTGYAVKLYVSNDTGAWDDKGQAHVYGEHDITNNNYRLKVIEDNTSRLSVSSLIRSHQNSNYHLRGNNIISWTEHEFFANSSVEVALLFYQNEACRQLWQRISQFIKINSSQQNDLTDRSSNPLLDSPSSPPSTTPLTNLIQNHSNTFNSATPISNDNTIENIQNQQNNPAVTQIVDPALPDSVHSSRFLDENLDHPNVWNVDSIEDVIFTDNNVMFLGQTSTPFLSTSCPTENQPTNNFVMPDPDRDGVETLSRTLSDQTMFHMPAVREHIVEVVSGGDYISKLCQVFRKAEQAADIDCLEMLYHIIRCFFSLGTNNVLEVLVNDKHILDVVGCLEYDPEKIPELRSRVSEWKNTKKLALSSTSSPSQVQCKPTQLSDDSAKNESVPSQSFNMKSTEKQDTTQSNSVDENESSNQTEETLHKLSGSSLPHPEASVAISREKSLATSPEQISHVFDNQSRNAEERSATSTPIQMSNDQSEEGSNIEEKQSPYDTEKVRQRQSNEEPTSFSGNNVDGVNGRSFIIRTHREFLQRKALFKSVVSITDPNVLGKIHQNYRVVYIRDVILSRFYDDNASNALSALILFNSVDIIMYFISGDTKLQELFVRLKAAVEHRLLGSRNTAANSCEYQSEKLSNTLEGNHLAQKQPTTLITVTEASAAYSTDCNPHKRTLANCGISPEKSDHERDIDSSVATNSYPSETRATGSTDESTIVGSKNSIHPTDSQAHNRGKNNTNDSVRNELKSSEKAESLYKNLSNLLGFLRELCGMVRMQQLPLKNRFHSLLLELGVLDIAVGLLQDEDIRLRSLCCDILSSTVTHNQSHVRYHILKNSVHQDSSACLRHSGDNRMTIMPFESVKQLGSNADGTGITAEFVSGGNTTDVLPSTQPRPLHSTRGNVPSLSTETIDQNKRRCRKANSQLSADDSPSSSDANMEPGPESSGLAASEPKKPTKLEKMETSPASEKNGKRPRSSKAVGEIVDEYSTIHSIEDDPGMDQSYRLQTRSNSEFPLLRTMVDVVCDQQENAIAPTVLDFLRTLLDPNTMVSPVDKKTFLEVFYKFFAPLLLRPIKRITENENDNCKGRSEILCYDSVCHVCDLLSFCVANNSYHSRYFVLAFNVGGKIAPLLNHERAHVRLSALRFIRACVGVGDEGYDRYITRRRLLDPVMQLYNRNGNRDNLTTSAILELIDRARKAPRMILLKYIVENHADILEPSSKHCTVFADLKATYEEEVQRQKSGNNMGNPNVGPRIANHPEISNVHRNREETPIMQGEISNEREQYVPSMKVKGSVCTELPTRSTQQMTVGNPTNFADVRDILITENSLHCRSFSEETQEEAIKGLQSFLGGARTSNKSNSLDNTTRLESRNVEAHNMARNENGQQAVVVETCSGNRPTVGVVAQSSVARKENQVEPTQPRIGTGSRSNTISSPRCSPPLNFHSDEEQAKRRNVPETHSPRRSSRIEDEDEYQSPYGQQRQFVSPKHSKSFSANSLQEKQRETSVIPHKPVRFTLSKSEVKTGELNETVRSLLEKDDGCEWNEESSHGEKSSARRERKTGIIGGIETCTTSVMKRDAIDLKTGEQLPEPVQSAETSFRPSEKLKKEDADQGRDENNMIIDSTVGIADKSVLGRRISSGARVKNCEDNAKLLDDEESPTKRRRLHSNPGNITKQT